MKSAIVLCVLAAAVLCSCSDANDPGRGPLNYDMTGTYTFIVNGNECTWVFTSNGNYEITGYGIIGTKTGTWSSEGNDVTISYATSDGGSISGNEVFTVQGSDGQVILRLKDSSAQVSLLLATLHLAATSVSLTKKTTSSPDDVDVTDVTLDQYSLTLTAGDTAFLTAIIEPSDATNKNVNWSSSNDNVATVDNGAVNAVTAGSATITVTTEDGGKTASCTVTVNPVDPNTVAVTGVTLNQYSLILTAGYSAILTATVEPSNATYKNVNWSSSNNGVATVDNGTVIAVAAGSAIITVTTVNGGKMASCTVTVNPVDPNAVAVTGVTLNHDNLVLTAGDTAILTATIEPSNATYKNVNWSSSNNGVATVDNGTVTAVAAGSATITVTTVNGGKTANCTVTVNTTSQNIEVWFNNLTADGSATTATTTKLILTFNQDITGLVTDDITLTPNSTGTTKGTLTRTGTGVYELPVSGIIASGQVSVAVSKSGYTIYYSSLQTQVYYVANSDIGIGIGEPSIKLYLNDSTSPLQEGKSTSMNKGEGTYTVSIASGNYASITWYINGSVVPQGSSKTSLTLYKRTPGTYLVTVEASPAGGDKNTGSHSFIVQ